MNRRFLINALTLSRVPLSLLFCAVVLLDARPFLPCAVIFALVAASDYWDGRLARKYGIQSRMGAILDVMSDLFFIVAASLALTLRDRFWGWMLAVILFKFMEFWITSAIHSRSGKSAATFLFDPLGRIVAVLFYVLPILMLLVPLCVPDAVNRIAPVLLCAGITGLAGISSVWRISSLIKER